MLVFKNDKEKNVVYFGNDSNGNELTDELFKYDEKKEFYFMVEKYNNDIGKSGMYFSSFQDSGKGELGILDNELFVRSYISYENKEKIMYSYNVKRGVMGRCRAVAYFNGDYKIEVMNRFVGDYGITFKNNSFNFYHEDAGKKTEFFILKEDDSFKFKTSPFFMSDFHKNWEVGFMNGRLDNRFSEIYGQHVMGNEMDGFVYERTFPANIEKPDEGISKFIGEYTAGKRAGLGCFRDPNDNFYLGKWYNNLFHGNGVIDTNSKASFGYFENGKQSALFLEVFENCVNIVRFEKGSIKYPFYRLTYDSMLFEKIDRNNCVVAKYSFPVNIKRKDDVVEKSTSVGTSTTRSIAATNSTQNNSNQNNDVYKAQTNTLKSTDSEDEIKNSPVYKREDYGPNSYYEGYFVNGKRHGVGSCFWKDGSKYFGEWSDGVRKGRGKYTFANGDYYEGSFKNDSFEGEGTYYYANGCFKKGVWQNGNCIKEIENFDPLVPVYKREEYGDGCYYEGGFMHGKRNGRGTCCWKDGSKYVGEWSGGVRKGRGKYTFANGDYYEGSFKNDSFEGEGTYYYANGCFKKGVWQNGICINVIESNLPNTASAKATVGKIEKSNSTVEKKNKPDPNTKVEKSKNGNGADINSEEFKHAMSIFSYKIKENNEVVISSCKNPPENIVIPEGVTSIFQKAFYNNQPENIKSVVIPSTVTKIGAQAFFNCVNLKKVVIGENVTKIGSMAFCRCNLVEIYIPDSVEAIEKMAFSMFDNENQVKVSVNEKCKIHESAFSKNCVITKRK